MNDQNELLPMNVTSESLGSFSAPAPTPDISQIKKDRLAQQADVKRQKLGQTQAPAQPTQEEFLRDAEYMNPYELERKYGREAAIESLSFADSQDNAEIINARGRDAETITSDALKGIGAGTVNSLGGTGSLIAGAVNADAGAWAADQTAQASEAIRNSQSSNLQDKRRTAAVRAEKDRQKNEQIFNEDVASGKPYAGLRRFGREFMDASSDLIENPALLGDLVAEGGGSLIGSFGIGKVAATGVAKVLLKKEGRSAQEAAAFLKTPAGRAYQQRVMEGTMPGAIAALEGGGAYAQIQGEIQGMSEEELMEGSPEYAKMRDDGMSHEEARNQIANIAGLKGGAIQGVVGAVTGKMVAKFESDPLGLKKIGRSGSMRDTLADLGKNILKETAEEGLQEGSSGVVTGAMVKEYADPDRDIFEGAGGNVAAGALAGAGTAGAVQAPRAAVDLTIGGAKAAATGLRNRLNSVKSGLDAESTVGKNAVREAGTNLDSALTRMRDMPTLGSIAQRPEDSGVSEESAPVVQESQENTEGDSIEDSIVALAAYRLQNRGEFGEIKTSAEDVDFLLEVMQTSVDKGKFKWVNFQQSELGQSLDTATLANLRAGMEANPKVVLQQLRDRIAATESGVEQKAKPKAAEAVLTNTVTGQKVVEAAPTPLSGAKLGSLVMATGDELNALPKSIQKTFNAEEAEIAADVQFARGEVLMATLEELEKGSMSSEDGAAASLWLKDQADQLTALRNIDENAIPEAGRADFIQARDAADTILGSATVKAAVEAAGKLTSEELGAMPEITAENLSSPEVRAAVRKQASLSRSNPAGVDPKFIDTLLDQKDPDGFSVIDDGDRRSMMAASALVKESKIADEAKAKIEAETTAQMKAKGLTGSAKKTISMVRDDILQANTNEKNHRGIGRHLADIAGAVASGDMVRAQGYMKELGELAQHFQNKKDAAQKSFDMKEGDPAKNKVSYDTWTGSAWAKAGSEGAWSIGINPYSPNSMQLKRVVEVDAASVARTYNSALKAYEGILTGDPIAFTKKPGSRDATVEKIGRSKLKPAQGKVDDDKASTKKGGKSKAGQKGTPPPADQTGTSSGQGTPPGASDPTTRGSVAKVVLPGTGKYVAKDQAKSDKANKMIGRGSETSSTNRYAKAWGDQANSGKYTAEDVVFVSAEGGRNNRIPINQVELKKATDAGATIITDVKADRERAYNVGEREVTTFLEANGYEETGPGVWNKAAEVTGSKSEQKNLKDLQAHNKKKTFTLMDEKSKAKIDAAIKVFDEFTGLKMGDRIKGVFVEGGKARTGYAWPKRGIIALSQTVIDKLEKGAYGHVLIHEAAHVFDINEDGSFKSLDGDRFSSKNKGDLYQEIVDLAKADEAYKKFFAYALGFKNDKEKSKELFAELFAVVTRNPELAAEKLPNGTQYIRDIILANGGRDVGRVSGKPPATGTGKPPVDGNDGEAQATPTFENLTKTLDGESRFEQAFTIDTGVSTLMTHQSPLANVVAVLDDIKSKEDVLDFSMDEARTNTFKEVIQRHLGDVITAANARLNQPSKYLRQRIGHNPDKLNSKGEPVGIYKNLTPMEAIEVLKTGKAEVDYSGKQEGFTLNLVDAKTGKYDQRLMESAATAALHWVMNSQPTPNMKHEEIAKEFGIDVSEINSDVIWAANNGMGQVRAKESLARTIRDFWGAQTNPNAPDSDILGISEGLASELLVAMEKNLISLRPIQLGTYAHKQRDGTTVQKPKMSYAVALNHGKTEAEMRLLKPAKSLLSDVYLPKSEKPVFIGEPVVGRVKRNNSQPGDTISKRIVDAVMNHRKIPHYINAPLHNLMSTLGRDNWLKMRGYKTFDPDVTHEKDAESIRGKNMALERSYDETMAHAEKVIYTATEKLFKPISEVASFFNYGVGSNDRIMAKGFNGQADKGMREVFAPTKKALDMTPAEPGAEMSDDQKMFWLTVVQSADIKGMKVEKDSHDFIFNNAESKMMEMYPNSIEIMKNAFANEGKISPTDQATIIEEIGGTEGATDKLIHAVQAVAHYQFALEQGGEALTQFDHRLSFEADGKTDGPINALVHFALGAFTERQLENYRKGGFFVNEEGQTLNGQNLRDTLDLYEAASVLAEQKVQELKEILKEGKSKFFTTRQIEAMQRILVNFGEMEFEDGNIIIGRKSLKNPLTISMYGSSAEGIAGKVAAGVVDLIYEKFSEVMVQRKETGKQNLGIKDLEKFKAYPGVWNDIELLMTNAIVFPRKGDPFVNNVLDFGLDTRREVNLANEGSLDLKKFLFSQDNMTMFRNNIKALYVDPMVEAIDETTGGAMGTMKVIQAATQIQSVTMLESFKDAVDKAIKEKIDTKKLKPGQTLSRRQYETIYKELLKVGAIIESTSGSNEDSFFLNLSGMERVTADGSFDRQLQRPSKIFSSGLQGEYEGPGGVMLPGTAGVSASPMVTISRGDARMMIIYYSSQNPNLQTQPVFDGLEISAKDIMEVSERINAAVDEGWMENPLAEVADSFNDWLKQTTTGQGGPIDGLTNGNALDAIWDAIASMEGDGEAIGYKRKEFDEIATQGGKLAKRGSTERLAELAELDGTSITALKEVIKEELVMLRDRLRNMSHEAQARKEVFSQVTRSVDHMAGAKSSYTFKGIKLKATTIKELMDELNAMYEPILARIKKEAGDIAALPSIEKPNAKFMEKIQKLGTKVTPAPGGETTWEVTRMTMKTVRGLMKNADLPKGHREIFNALEKALPNFTVVFGDRKDLNTYRDEFFPQENAGAIQNGQIDLQNGMIYIGNQTSETLLHELLHAATAGVVSQYYADPDSLSENQQNAIKNLEGLMNQFMGMDFSNEAPGASVAAETLWMEIAQAKREGNEFKALQEFLAWSLSNQALGESLRTSKTRTPLMKLVFKSMQALRRLLGLPQGQQLDMFANIAWNTGALVQMTGRPTAVPTLVLDQISPNTDARLQRNMQRFEKMIAVHLRGRGVKKGKPEEIDIIALANKSLALVTSSGFDLDTQQQTAFKQMQMAMASSMDLDKAALLKAQEVFTLSMQGMTVESLMQNPEPDANGNLDPNDYAQATEKFNLLVGKYGNQESRLVPWEKDNKETRSNILATFLALSQIDPELRAALKKVEMPKGKKITRQQTLDQMLENAADNVMMSLSNAIIGGGVKGSNAEAVLDRLTDSLAVVEKDAQTMVEAATQRYGDEADAWVSGKLGKGGEWLTNALTPTQAQAQTSDIRKYIHKGAQAIEALVTQDQDKQTVAVNTMASIRNNFADWVPQFIPKLIDQVIGITDENRSLYELMNIGKSGISRVRQMYRTEMPKVLAKQFSKKLTKVELGQLHLGFARTDIVAVAMGGKRKVSDILGMLQDKRKLDQAIRDAEEELRGLAHKNFFAAYKKKSADLAKFMTGYHVDRDNHLLARNADAIANLAGEQNRPSGVTPELVEAIDRLTSLYALDMIDPVIKASLGDLVQKEKAGAEYLLKYLINLRATEMAKATTAAARVNGYKGYVPSETKNGVDMKVADDSEHNKLVSQGYTRMGDYLGSGFESGKKGYYYSTVGGHAVFQPGIMQVVQNTAMGVDIANGRTLTGITGGRVDPDLTNQIKAELRTGKFKSRKEALLPVFDDTYQIVGFERSLAPDMIQKMRKNDDLGEMIGAWAGRHVEEGAAYVANVKLVQVLHKEWLELSKRGEKNQFIDLSDPKQTTEIERDAWNMIPRETKKMIKDVFGEDAGFMVKKSWLDNATGYRTWSIGEAWDGPSNMNPMTKRAIKDMATALRGKNAYRDLVVATKAIQAGVSVAKNIIVVLSIVVPLGNAASNVKQAMTLGVPVRDIINGIKLKLVEIERFQKMQRRQTEITAEKAVNADNEIQLRKLVAEEKSINDAIGRMSIGPLIKAGEFSSIQEGELNFDAAISQGNWVDKINAALEKLPEQAGTVGRYAAITRDTALFQGLARSVQYGDFIAKSVVYDHLTKKQGKAHKEAMKTVIDEFVAYNFMPSRALRGAEGLGLLWFMAFKIQSIKVAHRMLRNNPFRALMLTAAEPVVPGIPGVGVGSPITDNAIAAIADGKMSGSVGWGMGLRAPGMHPVLGAFY